MLEGSLCFSSGLSRRSSHELFPQASSPFAVRSSAVDYDSASSVDENARGEQWMPLWEQATTYRDLKATIAEGKSSLGRRPVHKATDFARSLSRMGTAKGFVAFQRYGYIERNGQANLATPLGRWTVQNQPRQNLVDEVMPWINSYRFAAHDKNAPGHLSGCHRACEEAVMACCRDGRSSRSWQNLLISLVRAEQSLLSSPKLTHDKGVRPLPKLSPQWIAATLEDSSTWRLALGMGSSFGSSQLKQHHCDPIRRHWVPLERDPKGMIFNHPKFNCSSERLLSPSEVVGKGRNLIEDAIQIYKRRFLTTPLKSVYGASGSLADINAFLMGHTDDSRLLALAWGFSAIQWDKSTELLKGLRSSLPSPSESHTWDGRIDSYGLFRLAYLGDSNAMDLSIPINPIIFQHLQTGQAPRAARLAVKRLKASGLHPYLQNVVCSPMEAQRLAASLIFPLRHSDMLKLQQHLTSSES